MKAEWKELYLQGCVMFYIISVFVGCPTIMIFLMATEPPTYSFQPILAIIILILLWFVVGPLIGGLLLKSSIRDLKSPIVLLKYVKSGPVKKRKKQREILFWVSGIVVGMGVIFTYTFEEVFWLGAKVGFLYGFMGICVLVIGNIVILRKYTANQNYQFHKQLIEKNIKVKDLQHFKELKQSFGPKTRRN